MFKYEHPGEEQVEVLNVSYYSSGARVEGRDLVKKNLEAFLVEALS